MGKNISPSANPLKKIGVSEGGDITPVLTVDGPGDEFVVGRGRDLVYFKWDGESPTPTNVTVLAKVDQDRPSNQFNDGKADHQGRIWAGTFSIRV